MKQARKTRNTRKFIYIYMHIGNCGRGEETRSNRKINK